MPVQIGDNIAATMPVLDVEDDAVQVLWGNRPLWIERELVDEGNVTPSDPMSDLLSAVLGGSDDDCDNDCASVTDLHDWLTEPYTDNDPFDFEGCVRYVKEDEVGLLLSKHHDYGPGNIARAPGGALNGLTVRLHDKLSRLSHLLESDANPSHESVRDTMRDIANYGTIGTLVIDGNWPDA